MSTWQERIRSKEASREAIADELVQAGNDVLSRAPLENDTHGSQLACIYRRYSGYVHRNEYNRAITGHEQRKCQDARDHGASLLIDKFAEQLRHVVPSQSRNTRGDLNALFVSVPHEIIVPISQHAQELHHVASQLHRLHEHEHGQRLTKKAAPLLHDIQTKIDRLHEDIGAVAHQLTPDDSARYQAETMLITHCHELLVLMQCYSQHCTDMLPSPQAKSNGR